jgi:hypothetical protein
MKKLALLLAVLMALTCSVAFADVAVTEPGTMPIVNEPLTLKVWAVETVGRDFWTLPMTTNFEKMTGIHIDWHIIGAAENGTTAFNLSIAGGDLPDIYMRSFSTSDIADCIEGSILLPLNDLIETQGIYYKQALAEQPQYVDMLTAPDGNIYTFMYTDTGVHKDSEYKMWVKTSWLEKTADEILDDVNGMQKQVDATTMNVERPDTLCVPSDVYMHISTKRIPDTTMTVMKFILENAPYLKNIVPAPELNANAVGTNPYAAAGGDGQGVAFLFHNDPEKMSLENPMAFYQYPLQAKNLEIVVPCEARTAGVIFYYPLSALIAVGVG